VGLLFSISTPANDAERLKSLARFVIVLFPIFMWLALATERRGRRSAVVAGSAALLAAFSAVFASGFWIA
jgi:hypothetical protein